LKGKQAKMRLYLLRHGHAEDTSTGSDHDRALTTEGIARLNTAAKVMRRLGIKPAVIFSSPRVRALQTAEIVADALGAEIRIREEVNFGFDTQAVRKLIHDLNDSDEVMFVGHEPSFSMTVRRLTGADIEMKKGGLARIDLTDRHTPSGVLVWLLAPAVFDALDST
jgi:phosphohistidine phosphatase